MSQTNTVTGVWVTPTQFRMRDARTNAVRMLFLPQIGQLEPAEIEDMVESGKEMFAAYVAEKGTHQPMPRQQQHEFGPHLRSIEASKVRFAQVGHGRYWTKE